MVKLDFSPARFAFAGFLLGAASFFGALALQWGIGLEPCPLCIVQRVAIIASSLLLLGAAAAKGPWAKGAKAFAIGGLAFAVLGFGVATRHMYVMWVPQEVGCGPSLEFMMESFPIGKWLPKVFLGEAECAAAAKHLIMGLPLPVWAAIAFAAQSVAAFLSLKNKR